MIKLRGNTQIVDSDLWNNTDKPGSPTDADWVTLGQNVINTDPAFCDASSGDYSVYAFSPCAPGVTIPELIGAYDVGCVPPATVVVLPASLDMPDSIVTACPAGDREHVVLDIDLDESVITRDIAKSELVLQSPSSSIAFFTGWR